MKFLFIILLVIIDQITKHLSNLIEYIDLKIIFFKQTINTGSAFSLFAQVNYYQIFVIILSIILIPVLIKFLIDNKKKQYHFILILIIAGIIGNFIDRILYFGVIDFIGIPNLFIFNIADIYLTIGAIYLILIEFKVKT